MVEPVPQTAAETAAVGVYRIALGVEYKGSRYRGFQRQKKGVPSIQEALEVALSKVAGGEEVKLSCAGRTDALVHASAQVVHFDTHALRSMRSWVMGANRNLPGDISVTWAKEMPKHFDARFLAQARRYRYVIYNDEVRPAHLAEEVTWNHRPLDVERMRKAAQYFVGTHDFSAFRAQQCQAKSPIKTLHHFEVIEFGRFIVLDVCASAFLHHMVRNFAGVLMAIGAGERPVEWAAEVLAKCERRSAGVTAHPHGLYLVQVDYPEEFEVPQRYLGPHFLSALPDVRQR